MNPPSQLRESPSFRSSLRSILFVLVLVAAAALFSVEAAHAKKDSGVANRSESPAQSDLAAAREASQQVSKGIRSGRNPSAKEIEERIKESARKYGLPADRVLRIARCESRLKPAARSKGGLYVGIYQFALKTWKNTPEGKAGLVREDPVANINAAHWHMKRYGYGAWGCK